MIAFKGKPLLKRFDIGLLPTKHQDRLLGIVKSVGGGITTTTNLSKRITKHLNAIRFDHRTALGERNSDNRQKNDNGFYFESIIREAMFTVGVSRSSAYVKHNYQPKIYGANPDLDIVYNTGHSMIVSMIKATNRERYKQAEYDAETLLINHLGCTDRLYRMFGYADYASSGVPLEIWFINGKEYPSYTPRRAIEQTRYMAGKLRHIKKDRCISVYSEEDMNRYLLSHKGR